jgi:tetratricopeptide (TPR) repeat protein
MQSVTETLGRTYTLGVLAKHKYADFEFKAAYDISAGEKEGFKDRFGIEIKWAGITGVRAGYTDGEFTFGAGLYLYDIKFDYAFVSNGSFGRMDRYTLSYAFGMTLEEQKAHRRRSIYAEVRRIVEERLKIKLKEEAEAYYRRAYAYYLRNEFEDALTEAEKSLEWKKDYEPSLKMKKILEEKLKEKIKSGEGTDYSGDTDAYISAGIELYEKKQYDEAVKQWENALKRRPGNKALRSLIAKAKKDMESGSGKVRLTREQKEASDKMYYLAVNSYTEGDLKGAVEMWKKVLAINPDDVKSLRDLRKTQAELEELKRRGIE